MDVVCNGRKLLRPPSNRRMRNIHEVGLDIPVGNFLGLAYQLTLIPYGICLKVILSRRRRSRPSLLPSA